MGKKPLTMFFMDESYTEILSGQECLWVEKQLRDKKQGVTTKESSFS